MKHVPRSCLCFIKVGFSFVCWCWFFVTTPAQHTHALFLNQNKEKTIKYNFEYLETPHIIKEKSLFFIPETQALHESSFEFKVRWSKRSGVFFGFVFVCLTKSFAISFLVLTKALICGLINFLNKIETANSPTVRKLPGFVHPFSWRALSSCARCTATGVQMPLRVSVASSWVLRTRQFSAEAPLHDRVGLCGPGQEGDQVAAPTWESGGRSPTRRPRMMPTMF